MELVSFYIILRSESGSTSHSLSSVFVISKAQSMLSGLPFIPYHSLNTEFTVPRLNGAAELDGKAVETLLCIGGGIKTLNKRDGGVYKQEGLRSVCVPERGRVWHGMPPHHCPSGENFKEGWQSWCGHSSRGTVLAHQSPSSTTGHRTVIRDQLPLVTADLAGNELASHGIIKDMIWPQILQLSRISRHCWSSWSAGQPVNFCLLPTTGLWFLLKIPKRILTFCITNLLLLTSLPTLYLSLFLERLNKAVTYF